jgi:hypothetical protein
MPRLLDTLFLLPLSLLLMSSGALAQRSADAESCLRTTASQADARACLERRERESEDALSRAEADYLTAVRASSLDVSERTAIAKALGDSSGPFRIYRSRQCDLQARVAAGGSGASHRRFVCLITLNDERLGHLRELKAQVR